MAAPKVENSISTYWAALLIATWATVLLAAFTANRGGDAGQLGNLISKLGGGPLFGFEGFRDSFVGGLIAVAVLISWFGLGTFLTSFIRRASAERHSHVLEIVMSISAGAAVWSLIWFFLGLVGLYNVGVAVAAAVIGLALAVYSGLRVREMRSESRTPEKRSGIDRLLIFVIAVPVILALIGSLAPPTAKDTLLYHFALPKAYVAQGGNAFVEGNIASYLALGGEMHNVWAMLLGGLLDRRAAEAAAGAVNWLFFPMLLAAIFGWARELDVSRRSGMMQNFTKKVVSTCSCWNWGVGGRTS